MTLNRNILLLGIAGLVIAIAFGVFQTATLIQVGDFPQEEKIFTFAGVDGLATAPTFSSVTSQATQISYEYFDDGTRRATYTSYEFCDNNDGDFKISNNLQSGETLTLTSNFESMGGLCNNKNGIDAEITLPRGVLTFSCQGDCEVVVGGQLKTVSPVVLESSQTVKMKVRTELVNSASAHSSLIIGFDEYEETEEIIVEEITNPTAVDPTPSQQTESLTFWDRLINWFRGLFS